MRTFIVLFVLMLALAGCSVARPEPDAACAAAHGLGMLVDARRRQETDDVIVTVWFLWLPPSNWEVRLGAAVHLHWFDKSGTQIAEEDFRIVFSEEFQLARQQAYAIQGKFSPSRSAESVSASLTRDLNTGRARIRTTR